MDTDEGGVIAETMQRIRAALARYRFTVQNEYDLQAQVFDALTACGLNASREVVGDRGRYDLLVAAGGLRVVLELKVKGGAEAVERQAQKYALTEDISAVAVVTTSNRLAHELRRVNNADTLGGKPFEVITLRTF